MTDKPDWRPVTAHVLWHEDKPTGIELHPEFGSSWFFVVDARTDEHKALTDALPLKQAKLSAASHAKRLGRM